METGKEDGGRVGEWGNIKRMRGNEMGEKMEMGK